MRFRPSFAAGAIAVLTMAGGAAMLTNTGARAATTTLCNSQTQSVAGGTYIVQNNEWGSSASECITTDGNADFTVANSAISNATNGAPGGYPSIYQGCHWGACSSGGLTSTPIQVSSLTPGKVTTSWSTTQPGGSNDYDVAYDIWFNRTPTTTGQPNCTELMVWLNHNGPVQPFGSTIASNVTVGGHTYNIWEGAQSSWDTISYDMTSGTTSVSNLDVGALAQDAVSRGYLSSSCYLIDVEAGFELWQGGAGLATNSFSVSVNGSAPSPSPTPASPSPSPTPTSPSPSPTPTGGSTSACSVAYSLVNSWPGGFQGQVRVSNTGSSAISGWTLRWTFPGDQKISSLWNGSYTQSGEQVTVTNAPYNATIAPGSSVTVGFTGTYTSSDASPTAFTVNGAACT
ncbi:MAG: cellulose binding domain-containing protein [Streptosporangiaceae bacterium]|nr:cellulose binding domain-containing protein [Streptosporangiaceae bacterium]